MTSDVNYQTNAAVLGGLTNGIADPALISKALHQGTTMAAALAQIVAASGVDVSDADMNMLASQLEALFPSPSSATPAMDGTTAAGTSAKYAREDHVHPTDNTRAALSTSVSATLTVAGWTGSAAPYTQAVAVAGLGAAQNGYVQIADGTTPAQRAAARYANMTKTAQAAGSITITADGTKPSIDIPITVVLEG